MPLACVTPMGYFPQLMLKIMLILLGPVYVFIAAISKRLCAGSDSSEWDTDADGEIDKDEFMQALPQGKGIANLCYQLAFWVYLFFFTGITRSFLAYFACDVFDDLGEAGVRDGLSA